MCMYRVNQHLTVLNLHSVSINEILVSDKIPKVIGTCFQK